jgi:hypothetical protein
MVIILIEWPIAKGEKSGVPVTLYMRIPHENDSCGGFNDFRMNWSAGRRVVDAPNHRAVSGHVATPGVCGR